jgi:transglutaminase-like putative cysteine protease
MTLDYMKKITQRAILKDARIRLFAEKITSGLATRDFLSEYACILNWVRVHIRYTRDPTIVEQVKEPSVIIETENGDCDDMTVLVGTLVGAMGGKVRYVAGAFSRSLMGDSRYTHVWAEAYDPVSKCWVVLDPVPGRNVGDMLNKIVDTLVVPVV